MAYLPAQAKPAAGDLFSKVSDLSKCSPDEIDDLVIARIRQGAERLKRADPTGAYTILGALAAVKWDEASLRDWHEKALRLAGENLSGALMNYSVSLEHIGDVDGAYEKVVEAFRIDREDLSILRRAVDLALRAGRYEELKALLETWDRQSMEPHEDADSIHEIIKTVESAGITQDDLRRASEIIYSLPKEARTPIYHVRYEFVAEKEIAQQIDLIAPVSVASGLNEEIAGIFVNEGSVAPSVSKVFTVYFVGCGAACQ